MGVTAAVVVGAATVAGAAIASDASRKAANTQADAARQATDTQWGMYQQQREDLAPWRQTGEYAKNVLWALQEGRSTLPMTPGAPPTPTLEGSAGYQFQLAEGQKAIERSAAARGGLMGGGTQKALMGYSQGLAAQEYQNWLNNWYNMAGMGANAASQTANAAGQAGQGMAQTQLAGGAAQAAGYLGQGNIWGNALNNAASYGAQGYYGNMGAGNYQNPYMNQLIQNRNAINYQTGGRYAYGL